MKHARIFPIVTAVVVSIGLGVSTAMAQNVHGSRGGSYQYSGRAGYYGGAHSHWGGGWGWGWGWGGWYPWGWGVSYYSLSPYYYYDGYDYPPTVYYSSPPVVYGNAQPAQASIVPPAPTANSQPTGGDGRCHRQPSTASRRRQLPKLHRRHRPAHRAFLIQPCAWPT